MKSMNKKHDMNVRFNQKLLELLFYRILSFVSFSFFCVFLYLLTDTVYPLSFGMGFSAGIVIVSFFETINLQKKTEGV